MGSKAVGTSNTVLRRDPYEVLSVSKDATEQDIKSAYRKLALKYKYLTGVECGSTYCDQPPSGPPRWEQPGVW